MLIPSRSVAQMQLATPTEQSWRGRPAIVPQAFPPAVVSTTEVALAEANAKEYILLSHVSVLQTSGVGHTISFHVYESGGTAATGNKIAQPSVTSGQSLRLELLEDYMVPAGYVLTALTSTGTCNISLAAHRIYTGT